MAPTIAACGNARPFKAVLVGVTRVEVAVISDFVDKGKALPSQKVRSLKVLSLAAQARK